MLFTSLEFLLVFLPPVLAIYFLLPGKFKNYWLLMSSLFFYGWGEPSFLKVMVASIIFNYLMALAISLCPQSGTRAKLLLTLDVLGNLGVLFLYKYMNFATGTLLQLIPQSSKFIHQTSIVLPIGISFFTFQAMSYVIDVYRGTKVQKNPAFVGLYISLFPQLIAGPIVRYTTIEEQIHQRRVSFDDFSQGVYRFMLGFNKKVLLSNALAAVADTAFEASELTVSLAWLGALCYSLQIFFDFSGYSDMAIGLGRMFGFRFLENFNYPYISKTITEFWRRWHISLSSWFRDYLYFPLGGSRVSYRWRLVFNLMVVWCATGIWHGANWTFIAWGLIYGVLITVEKLLGLPKKLEGRKGLLPWCYRLFTLLVVMLCWVLFRADNISAGASYIGTMFGAGALYDPVAVRKLEDNLAVLIVACLASTPIFKKLGQTMTARGKGAAIAADSIACAVQLLLFLVSISQLVMNAYNPFIYFNF